MTSPERRIWAALHSLKGHRMWQSRPSSSLVSVTSSTFGGARLNPNWAVASAQRRGYSVWQRACRRCQQLPDPGAKGSTLTSLYPQPKGEAPKAACTASGLGVSTAAKSRKHIKPRAAEPSAQGRGTDLSQPADKNRKPKRPLHELRAPGSIRRLGPTRGFAGCRVGQVVRGNPSRLHVNPPLPTRSSK